MTAWRVTAFTGSLVGLCLLAWGVLKGPGSPRLAGLDERALARPKPVALPQLQTALGKLPVYFIQNQGQLDSRVAYYVQGQGLGVYFSPGGVTFAFTERQRQPARRPEGRVFPAAWQPSPLADEAAPQRWAVKLEFVGAKPWVEPVGVDRTPTLISYFKGRQPEWKTGLATYSSVVYRDLWPGIDLVYSGEGQRLKYEFVVRPGAEVEQIKVACRGAGQVRVNADGELEISTPVGGFRDQKPYAYQEQEGRPVEVAAGYELEGGSGDGAQVYGFRVGAYDRSRPLVLDPVLAYAGYIGGSGNEIGNGIAVDGAGNAYVTGETSSTEAAFPVTVGPDLTFNGGTFFFGTDAFVAKVNAAGALVYAGYIGGSGDDVGRGIAVDAAGNAYVTGDTNSTEATFPVTVGPDLTFNGGSDAFVAKVNAAGTALVYAGYIGGSDFDHGLGIAVDATGNAYVTGFTSSTEATFPVKVGPDLTSNGFADAFVAKVNAAGTALVYCGYIGGGGNDAGVGIAVDAAGNAYVTGGTSSAEDSFPVKVGPELTFKGCPGETFSCDAFVAKVNAAGTALVYCGYIGGGFIDFGSGIAVDAAGNAYVTGSTASSSTDGFPVTVGPDLTFNGGSGLEPIVTDAFVAKVNAAGTALVYCGYIGGSSDDKGLGIAVDAAGNAYVTGDTDSTEATFPVTVGPDLTSNGGRDAFVAKVNAAGTALVYAGYIGGSGNDFGNGIAVDAAGNAYVTGSTLSTQATFPVTVGPDLTFNGGFDAFVAKVTATRRQVPAPPPRPHPH